MPGTVAEQQYAEIWPPRRGLVLAIAVDSTARVYDLSALVIGGEAPDAANSRRREAVVWMQAETNDVFFYFSDAIANDLSDTAVTAASGGTGGSANTAAYATTYCAVLKAGNVPIRVNLNRVSDKYLVVKTASTGGNIRIWAGSESI